jgi:transglutaminase-like putative cysteine protease
MSVTSASVLWNLAGATANRIRPVRLLALGGVLALLGGFLSVPYEVLVITGDPVKFYYTAGAAVVLGTVTAKLIRPRTAIFLAVVVAVGGTYFYLRSIPGEAGLLRVVAPTVDDITVLLSGVSILRILNADIWTLSAIPAPVFLTWYFALRRRYVAASVIGGIALGFVVLTGDAKTGQTLVGVTGMAIAVAFGDCDHRDEPLGNTEQIVVAVAAMVGLALVIAPAAGAGDSLLSSGGGGNSGETIESSLVHAGDSVTVVGSIELSPERRYTVEADEEAYWRVRTFDRYTGSAWVRSGSHREDETRLSGPPGENRTLEQTYTAKSTIATLPAAREPVEINDVPVSFQVLEGGEFEPSETLQPGESYTVESEVPVASSDELREAGTEYPERIEERYTQLPTDTPDRVTRRTDRLTENTDNPYDTARVLEYWLRTEYNYSLDVERPRGDVADAFLFEMDAGYCTYFATTMVTMLRTQGIPARFTIGYTPGERVADGEWVVRGYNSHAWVEVYFPEYGWIEFDPTPSDPRRATERRLLDADSEAEADTPDQTLESLFAEERREVSDGTNDELEDPEIDIEGLPEVDSGADTDSTTDSLPVPVPTSDQFGFGLLALFGVLVGVHRSNFGSRLYREVWLRWLPDGGPDEVVVAAYRRAVYLQERTGRTKRPGETPRQFFAGTDDRFQRIAACYERARYGDGVDATKATEIRADLAELLSERSRVPHLIGKPDSESR